MHAAVRTLDVEVSVHQQVAVRDDGWKPRDTDDCLQGGRRIVPAVADGPHDNLFVGVAERLRVLDDPDHVRSGEGDASRGVVIVVEHTRLIIHTRETR